MNYSYNENDINQGGHKFNYILDNVTSESSSIYLNGDGVLNFSTAEGELFSNSGDVTIDSEISLSMFGLPEALGTTPVHIDSKVKLTKISDE